jgi:uridylate kinase
MDLLGARVIERSSMECWIFDGRNTEDLKNALRGNEKNFSGSIIK